MNPPAECIVCELTPPGRAAIATIAVAGPKALAIASRFFRAASGAPLAATAENRIVFGRWSSAAGESPGEELCLCRTSPEILEIHCHGGNAATAAILAALASAGAEVVSPSQWLARHAHEALVAPALSLLGEARTARTAAILLDQTRGAYARAIREVCSNLERGDFETATTRLRRLLNLAPVGLHLTKPFRVVLAGAPNVGKSSLINKLVGYERSIVFDLPGTTRDVIAATTAFDGWLVEMRDTAGVRQTADPLEAEGSDRARQQMRHADVVVWVRDATDPSPACEFTALQPTAAIVVWNKCDLAEPPQDDALRVSAKSGAGLAELQQRIVAHLVPHLPQPGEAVPLTTQQVAKLSRALTACRAGDATAAMSALESQA
jgi:tRNA modification GTPase